MVRGTMTVVNGVGQLIHFGQTLASMRKKTAPQYQPPPLKNTDPMEGFTSGAELENYRYRQGSFYLGKIHPEHGQNFNAGVFDDRHVFMVAGNASGKGRSIIIQNALRWQGGFFGLDPKGELASITAMRRGTEAAAIGSGTSVRKFIGQQVAVLDPFGEVEGAARCYHVRYNPLVDIDITDENAQGLIRKIASSCIVPEEGTGKHFSESAETILSGVIEAVLLTYPKAIQTLPEVRKIMLLPFDEVLDVLEDKKPFSDLREKRVIVDGEEKLFREKQKSRGRIPDDGLAAEAIGILADMIGSDEANSFKTTLSRHLKWLSEPKMKRHLEASDVSVSDIVKTGGSVYVVVPPDRIGEFKSWLRIITRTALSAKISLGVYQTTQPTMFMLDEFALLGHFSEIEASAGYLRGYNCKLVCVIQNIGQIKKNYKDNWETFLGNAGVTLGFALNDLETEEYFSKKMGKILAWETSYSVSDGANFQGMQGGGNAGKSVNQAQRERPVRYANEVHDQTARGTMRAFAVPADGKPVIIHRQNYDDIAGAGIYDSPQYCQEWERLHAAEL